MKRIIYPLCAAVLFSSCIVLPSHSVNALEGEAQTVIVDTASDAGNGDCSSIASLLNNPGADGISLREAMEASNNTPGPKIIKFSEAMKGKSIVVGTDTNNPLPLITGGDMIMDGDVDSDGNPDVTIDGSLGLGGGNPLANGIRLWSSNNTIERLIIKDFCSSILSAVPENDNTTKTIAGNKIIDNIISTPQGGISIGPLGYFMPPDSAPISNITWKDYVISGNRITASSAIFCYAAAAFANNNHILNIQISNNDISSEGGVGFLAADTDTGWQGMSGPYSYCENNSVEGVTISGNKIRNVKYKGVELCGANMGNRYNTIKNISVTNNTIAGVPGSTGVIIYAASENDPASDRSTGFNNADDIVVQGNTITGFYRGIEAAAGGAVFVRDDGSGCESNTLKSLSIDGNEISGFSDSGITLHGGVTEKGTSICRNNSADGVTISNNYVHDSVENYSDGIVVFGGFSGDGALITGNSVKNTSLKQNKISTSHTGIRIVAGSGSSTSDNDVSVTLDRNEVKGNTPVEIFDNYNSGLDNTVTSVINYMREDLNMDYIVDIKDLSQASQMYNKADSAEDINGDGCVDIYDLTGICRRMW